MDVTDYTLQLETPPAVEPVMLSELKTALSIEHALDDMLLTRLIATARQHVESITRRALVKQTWLMHLDKFHETITIPVLPLQVVDEITYIDDTGAQQIMDPADYLAAGARITPVDQWPAAKSRNNAVTVRFTAGYYVPGETDLRQHVPEPLKWAVIAIAGGAYENRESAHLVKLHDNKMVAALIEPYRMFL